MVASFAIKMRWKSLIKIKKLLSKKIYTFNSVDSTQLVFINDIKTINLTRKLTIKRFHSWFKIHLKSK